MKAYKELSVSRWFIALILVVCLALSSGTAGAITISPEGLASSRASFTGSVPRGYGQVPLFFIENQGQIDRRVKYYARGKGYSFFFTDKGLILSLKQKKNQAHRQAQESPKIVQLAPISNQPGTDLVPGKPLPGRVNYFAGSEPEKWRTGIPSFGEVVYREAFPGIDLKFYGNGQQVEYDLIIKPGTDLKKAVFEYQGIHSLALNANGEMVIRLSEGGELLQKKPVAYQEINGRRVSRQGKFRLLPETEFGSTGKKPITRYGFEVASYDSSLPLIIDPVVLVYSTYLGGTTWESGNSIAVDGSGCAYVVGSTESSDFPMLNPAQGTYGGGISDVFITKFSAQGSTLLYSTFLGGTGEDIGLSVKVDAAGNAYLAGETYSTDFPTTVGAYQTTLLGPSDAFLTKLDPSGQLVLSTYLGGSGSEAAKGGVALDKAGNIYVAGDTNSSDFPLLNQYQDRLKGSSNTFVTKFTSAGALAYSTYLGGSVADWPWGLAVDNTGSAYVAGETYSPDFPTTTAAFQTVLKGPNDAFVTKLHTSGASLVYSTYLGGSGADAATGGIALDSLNNALVAGNTNSATDFPTILPFQATLKGTTNAFITKLNGLGTPVFSSYLGGSSSDLAWFIAVDKLGDAYLTGETDSTDFPVVEGYQDTLLGIKAAFVTKVKISRRTISFSTFLGGTGQDFGFGIAVNKVSKTYVTGYTESLDFPQKNPYQASLTGAGTSFVTELGLFDISASAALSLLLLD